MRQLSLRARILVAFSVGALASCASMAVLSFELTRQMQLATRERSAVRAAYLDARVVGAGLAADQADVLEVLRELDTGANRRALLRRDGRWYARSVDVGLTDAVPAGLAAEVAAGRPMVQRVTIAGTPHVVTGVPLPGGDQFYVVDSLRELDATLRLLSWILVAVATGTTLAGALLGAYTARRVVRPLRSVTAAAREIGAGDLDARLDPKAEPDLEELAGAFNHMVEELARRMERDRRFAADVSHELRSPLQTLTAAVDVMANRRDHLDPRARRALDLIVEESSRFRNLVTDLLELAREGAEPELEPVDVLELARRACRNTGVDPTLVVDRTDGDVVWSLDRRRFDRVLANLLDNARRYGGGAVLVSVGSQPGRRYVEVDDGGPGVAVEDQGRIFERFVRGRTAGTRGSNDGVGLGLALALAHAHAHGGDITVENLPAGGARFRVTLPKPAQAGPRSSLAAVAPLLLVGVLVGAVAGCGITGEDNPRAVSSPPPLKPPTAGDQADGVVHKRLYLVRDGLLTPVLRPAVRTATPAELIGDLSAGPTEQEAAAGFTSALAGADLVRSVQVQGSVAVVELVAPADVNRGDETLAYAQMVLTLTQRQEISGVTFTVGGVRIAVPRADALLSEGPLRAADYTALLAR
ncbi:hypothetical protein GCM10010201_26370 [Pilimelia columellifera subsp. columellifera]|uniref:histidine kinase n=1 Tax=Pilimelia columellifera subsp. columellifera TaxID=706583 RepID=A0ABN3NME9_9ACTN